MTIFQRNVNIFLAATYIILIPNPSIGSPYSHNAETARTFLDIQFQKEHQQGLMETCVLHRLPASA